MSPPKLPSNPAAVAALQTLFRTLESARDASTVGGTKITAAELKAALQEGRTGTAALDRGAVAIAWKKFSGQFAVDAVELLHKQADRGVADAVRAGGLLKARDSLEGRLQDPSLDQISEGFARAGWETSEGGKTLTRAELAAIYNGRPVPVVQESSTTRAEGSVEEQLAAMEALFIHHYQTRFRQLGLEQATPEARQFFADAIWSHQGGLKEQQMKEVWQVAELLELTYEDVVSESSAPPSAPVVSPKPSRD